MTATPLRQNSYRSTASRAARPVTVFAVPSRWYASLITGPALRVRRDAFPPVTFASLCLICGNSVAMTLAIVGAVATGRTLMRMVFNLSVKLVVAPDPVPDSVRAQPSGTRTTNAPDAGVYGTNA